MSEPRIAIAVASHDRAVRLRWLLNALEEQTAPAGSFEVVVAHDESDPATARLLAEHPLAAAGALRDVAFPGRQGPTAMRNAAWRAARAPVVAFTDDDCRPPTDWVERALAAAAANPGAVVQGSTAPDPDEAPILTGSPHARSQSIDAPSPWAQTCNIIYPRELLELLGGFEEDTPLRGAEDTDLALRAVAAGAPYVGVPEVLTYHAVADMTLAQRLRWTWPWQNMAYAVKRHPELRRSMPLRIFWKPTHGWLSLAGLGGLLAWRLRSPLPLALGLPWARATMPGYGTGARGRLRALLELPGRAVVDLTELAALIRGSIRHRTLFL